MPDRRCRKASAILLCGLLSLLLWQTTCYPVHGSSSVVSQAATLNNVNNNQHIKITVKKGDTLWEIAQRYGTTIEAIVQRNNIVNPNLIFVGQTLLIPGGKPEVVRPVTSQTPAVLAQARQTATHAVEKTSNVSRGFHVSEEELHLLARIIYAEARGEDFEGQVAVGAVVLNRVKDPRFPNTIRDVIYQRGAFTAVVDKQINLQPNERAYQAALAALAGEDPTGGALYYYNPRLATDSWIKTRQVIKTIGNHNFSI